MTEAKLKKTRQQIVATFKQKRVELNLSQDALSKVTGLGIATIKRAENVKLGIGLKQFIIICDKLKIDFNKILN